MAGASWLRGQLLDRPSAALAEAGALDTSDSTSHGRGSRILAALALLLVTSFLVSTGAASAATRRAPTLKITSQPANPTTSSTATVRWSTTGASTYASLDGKSWVARRGSVTYTNLTLGTHRVDIKTVSRYGSTQKSVTWTIIGAPSLEITTAPPSVTADDDAVIAWTTYGATSVTASLDGGSFSPAISPKVIADLPAGEHTITVRAANAAGATTDQATWTIDPESEPDPSPTGGGTLVQTGSVAGPQSPASYALPSGAARVTTSEELSAALASTTARDIVLADGVYDSTTYFSNLFGHRLYAEHLGGAVLTAGLQIGQSWSPGGAIVRGLVFDITDAAKTLQGGAITIWGSGGANAQVLDTVVRGHFVLAFGIRNVTVEGFVAQRLDLRGFTDVGLRVSDDGSGAATVVEYGQPTPRAQLVSDVYVEGVSWPVPGSSNSTEAGLWIGNPVVQGVHRIVARDCARKCIETVNNSWDTVFSDLDLDPSGPHSANGGIGVYMEHYSVNNVFQNFVIRNAARGFNGEWNDPATGGRAGSTSTTIRNGLIDAGNALWLGKSWGIYLDQGTTSTTVTGVVFRSQNFAAIGAFNNLGTNTFTDNDYSGLLPGALPVSTSPWSSSTP